MNPFLRGGLGLAAALFAAGTVAAYEPTLTYQTGYRGLGMQLTEAKDVLADKVIANAVPEPITPLSTEGEKAADAYKNVQLLGHLSTAQFTRLMTSITEWVAGDAGCAYCHAPQKDENGNIVRDEAGYPLADLQNMHSDEVYAKNVARKMLLMTWAINQEWKSHVQNTGVSCYTCHRGQPVPSQIWYDPPDRPETVPAVGYRGSQNAPNGVAGLSSLPNDFFEAFLSGDPNPPSIRLQTDTALPSGNRMSTKQAEWTYGLMMHMSTGLGVNCTYCHNSRAFGNWAQSPPQRATAWHGIQMVRAINKLHLEPASKLLPASRLGPEGGPPKANCATCHHGAFKPLLGMSMLGDFPSLVKPGPPPGEEEAKDETEETEETDVEDTAAGGGDAAEGGGDATETDAGAGGAAPAPDAPATAAPEAPAPKAPAPKAPAPEAPEAP